MIGIIGESIDLKWVLVNKTKEQINVRYIMEWRIQKIMYQINYSC